MLELTYYYYYYYYGYYLFYSRTETGKIIKSGNVYPFRFHKLRRVTIE